MQQALSLLSARVESAASSLYINHEQVNADKRLLLQRTLDSIAALDDRLDRDSMRSSSRSDSSEGADTSEHSARRSRRQQRRGTADNVLPLLTLLPLTHTTSKLNDNGLTGERDEARVGLEEQSELEAAEVDVLGVEAEWEGGVADSGCCDGRWLIRARIRSRSLHALRSLTLRATASDAKVDSTCRASVLDYLSPNNTVALLCAVDVMSATPAELLNLRTLLTISHSRSHSALAMPVTCWTRQVQLPRFSFSHQRLSLLPPSVEGADVAALLSLAPLSSATQPLTLRIDSSPPSSLSREALSSLLQQRLCLQSLGTASSFKSVCGVADAQLSWSDELFASSPRAGSAPSACSIPGLCCVLSALPFTAGMSSAPASFWLRLYGLSDLASLCFVSCLRAELPATCELSVDVAHPLSLNEVRHAVTAMLNEAEEAVSAQQPVQLRHAALYVHSGVRSLVAHLSFCCLSTAVACALLVSQLTSESEMERLWREMDLPGVVSGGGSAAAYYPRKPSAPAAAGGGAAEAAEVRTTQQMLECYYRHIERLLSLLRASDERMCAVHGLAEGADSNKPPPP